MILFWNRKEIYNGFSLEEFSRIRRVLDENNIPYDIRIVNRNTAPAFDPIRGRIGSMGQNLKYSYEYYIYVHKGKYDEALYIIRGR